MGSKGDLQDSVVEQASLVVVGLMDGCIGQFGVVKIRGCRELGSFRTRLSVVEQG